MFHPESVPWTCLWLFDTNFICSSIGNDGIEGGSNGKDMNRTASNPNASETDYASKAEKVRQYT